MSLQEFTKYDSSELDKRYWVQLINSLSRLSYAKPDRKTERIPLVGVDNKI